MSQTHLYFHLNVMKRAGLIQVVSKILEGRHKVSHSGHVARTMKNRDPEDSLITRGHALRSALVTKFKMETTIHTATRRIVVLVLFLISPSTSHFGTNVTRL